jgi:hypothetical protein
MDEDIERHQGRGKCQHRGFAGEAREVQPRAEDHEVERDEEAFGNAAYLRREPFRTADQSHRDARAEARDEDAGAALLGDPGQHEQHQQRQAQIERPVTLLGEPADVANPVVRADRPCRCQRQRGRTRYQRCAQRGVRDPSGLEHDRDREDRDHIGDRHLCDHGHRGAALHAQFLECGQQHGGRAGGEHERIDRSVSGPGDRRSEQSRGQRQQAHDQRQQRAAPGRGRQPAVAQRQVHPHRQHQHREAHLPEREDRRIGRIHPAEHRRSDENPGQDLTDDDRYEAPLAEHSQERTAEAGEDDHDQRSEAHRHLVPPVPDIRAYPRAIAV